MKETKRERRIKEEDLCLCLVEGEKTVGFRFN